MNEKQYVTAIARKVRCSGKKKREIKKQLLTDIYMRAAQGEEMEEILSQMGTVKEIADGFNENLSMKERKQYIRNKVLKIVVPVVAVLVFLILFVYWMIPKSVDIGKSKYFNKEQVEAVMKETIELLDAEDYAVLQERAILQMQPLLTAEKMNEAKEMVSDEWGERKQFGAVYMVELIQGGRHFAVGEITVTYEHVSVTYRLTYDENMDFAGIYVR